MDKDSPKPRTLNIQDLLRPHTKLLMVGLAAVIGEGAADLLQPWPLKIVLDNVLKSRDIHGWLNQFIVSTVGQDKLAILRFAALAVLVVAVVDAICTYSGCRSRIMTVNRRAI
jgi:ATP-binding cassette subfamily B protein